MTRPDLAAILARCDAATPGPWRVDGNTYDEDCNEHLAPYGLEGPNERLIWSSGGGEYSHPDMATAQFIARARADIPALLAYVEELEADRVTLLHREIMLKRAHGALADAGCVAPIELDKSTEHAIHALAERALTAEERLEQRTKERDEARSSLDDCLICNRNLFGIINECKRERDEARAQLAALDTGSPCDGHRHCCADRRRLADELLRVRAERDALRSSLDRKIRHCDEITEERDALKDRP